MPRSLTSGSAVGALAGPMAVCAALVLALSGCGSSDPAGEVGGAPVGSATSAAPTESAAAALTGGLPDPCTLLTTADITAATGLEFGNATPNKVVPGPDRAACDWVTTGSDFATAQVLLSVPSASSFDDARSGATSVFDMQVEDVTVAGADRAFAVEGGNIVGMDLGTLYLQVSYTPSSPEDVLAITSTLAEEAAGQVS